MLAGLIITAIAYSQPPTGDDDDVTDVVELVPLDGALSILLGAGIALGAKKPINILRKRKITWINMLSIQNGGEVNECI